MKVLLYTVLLVFVWTCPWAEAGPSSSRLVLSSDGPERVLACVPVETGSPIYLEFINSIYLAPVRETLVFTETEGIVIVRVESPSAGVFEYYGLEPDSSGSAEMHRRVGRIRIRSNNYENHRVTAGGRVIRLKEVAEGGEPVILDIISDGAGCGQ